MKVKGFFKTYSLYLAWMVSIIATGGSLYLSEVLLYEPCKLCWIQRIFMYPQVILLGIASYKDDRKIISYVLPLSIIGGCVSIFHYLEQMVPAFSKIAPCSVGIPCNVDYLNWFGFITIPLLALIAFIMIICLMLAGRSDGEEEDIELNEEQTIIR
ncbi:disulfide oxidoreductase [Paenibacillus crassostreae]|uniref:Disulfide oxidoreductase n=1 Tax=Paenibacillus crassostreae TaxID=1763538 RepID=A0A167AIU8_9BACL|nr:disulfide oxidoreductase [Paenibacillus crassostreae]AOZ92363.1 disulfide oxidoreductase [Paenibacillus crassostreae]OAB71078.1 disulfide oxidoreductase [Paenibacillus crassostreae]